MQQLDFSSFQPLNGSAPFRVVSVHPTEPLVALQALRGIQPNLPVLTRSNLRCALWNRETCEIVNQPDEVVVMAWNAEGNELGLIRENYHGLHSEPATSHTWSYTWERYTWPEQTFLQICGLLFTTHWPEIIVFSPLGNLAVIQWFEAEKSGLDFIDVTQSGDCLLESTGLPHLEREGEYFEEEEDERFFVDTNLATRPVFSPDGRYLVFCWQSHQRWWTDVPDDVYVESELTASVGTRLVGYAQIIDWRARSTRREALFVKLPPGWQPSYEGDISDELLPEPVFIDARHFQVLLPTGKLYVADASM